MSLTQVVLDCFFIAGLGFLAALVCSVGVMLYHAFKNPFDKK